MPKKLSTLTGSVELDELVALIGWDKTLDFAEAFGGQRYHVGAQPRDNLVAVIGKEAAHELCAYKYKTRLVVPISFKREAQVRALAGCVPTPTINEIAEKVGVTYRFVQSVLARPRGVMPAFEHVPSPQMSIFDRL